MEPPYRVIADRLRKGRLVPFLGNGTYFTARPPREPWNPKSSAFPPSSGELASFLANQVAFPSSDPREREDLARVCSYFRTVAGRRALREQLHDVFDRDYPHGDLHSLLATLPTNQIIVDTTFSTQLEQAFRAAGKPYDIVMYSAESKEYSSTILWWPYKAEEPILESANQLDIDLHRTTVIFKIFGSVVRNSDRWDAFVITEEDFVDFLARMMNKTAIPALFYPYFSERGFLFLGYSLASWSQRVAAGKLTGPGSFPTTRIDRDEDTPLSFAIQMSPSELDKRLWDRSNVRAYDLTLDEFVAKLQEFIGK